MIYPLNETTPEAAGLAPKPLAALDALIRRHLDEDRYPGAQIAIARNGKLALLRSYGDARTEPAHVPVTNDTLFLLFSQTKVLTSSAVWTLSRTARSPSWTAWPITCRSSPPAEKARSPWNR